MNNTGFQIPQNKESYSGPTTKTGAGPVNIYISGINTPGYPPAQSYYPPPGYYYPPSGNWTNNINTWQNQNNQQANQPKPISAQDLSKTETNNTNPVKPKEEDKKKPDKKITPLTQELIDGLMKSLTQGDKQTRLHAIAKTVKLLREDVKTRKNDPRLLGLINTALHQNQPGEVNTTAMIACNNDIITGNQKTAELLNILANKNGRYGNNSLASAALNTLPTSAYQQNNAQNTTGQKLNLVSE